MRAFSFVVPDAASASRRSLLDAPLHAYVFCELSLFRHTGILLLADGQVPLIIEFDQKVTGNDTSAIQQRRKLTESAYIELIANIPP